MTEKRIRSNDGTVLRGGAGKLWEKRVPLPLYSLQIPQRMGLDPRTRSIHQREEFAPGRIKLHKEELRNMSQLETRMDKSHGCS